MEGTILGDIKKMLGLDDDYDVFDRDIKILINSALMSLGQIGAVDRGKKIDDYESWEEICPDVEGIKLYLYIKVRMVFDPPTGAAMEALKSELSEIEWRLSIDA